jgi:integrase
MESLITAYLAAYQGRLKPSTLVDYRSILRHHLANFANLDHLNEGLEAYLSGLSGLSGKRLNNILSVARSLMAFARRRRLWSGDPLFIPRWRWRSQKIAPLSPEEVQLLMAYAPHPYRDFFHLSLLTGMRTGEALGLKFEDFDFQKGVIEIRRALTVGEIVSTKTVSGDRDFPLLRPLREIFNRRARGNEHGSAWFFYSHRPGEVFSRWKLGKVWKALLSAFKIRPRPLYSTRHTFASLAVASGEDPLWIAQVMGHSRPDQLFLRYSSYLKGVKPDGEKLCKMVMGDGPATFLKVVR